VILQSLNSHRISGQVIDDQNLKEGGIDVQGEVQNQDSLSPSSSTPAIQSVTENGVLTPGDVASGSALSAAMDQRIKDLGEDFWRFHSKWINNSTQEVRFPFVWQSLMSLTFYSGVKWSENAADHRRKALNESRELLYTQFSTSLETIQLDIYVAARVAFRDGTCTVRTAFSFSANSI
jgi:hypothetical protein